MYSAHKISKIYIRFAKFQKYTPVALWGRQGLNIIFFLQICNEVPGEKKVGACRPPLGRPVGPAYRRARGAGRPTGQQGGLSPAPRGRPGQATLYKASPSFPPHLTSKNPEKREG